MCTLGAASLDQLIAILRETKGEREGDKTLDVVASNGEHGGSDYKACSQQACRA